MGAVGLQTHIWSNNFKSVLLLIGFPILLIGLIYCAQLGAIGYFGDGGGKDGLTGGLATSASWLVATAPLALGASGVWYAVAFFAHNSIIAGATGARKVERRAEPDLYNLLENLAISRGLRAPDLYVIESPSLNAYASGLTPPQYRVTVTRGLLQTLSRDELECVLAHELTHIINRDVRLMVIAAVFAGVISLIAQIIFRVVMHSGGRASGRSRSGGGGGGAGAFILIALAAAGVSYLLAIVIQMAISRRREFLADAGAVELTKNPDAMITALQKISGNAALEAPQQIRGMFIENADSGFAGLFSTHPPIAKRIEALVKFAGGRLPDPVNTAATPPFEALAPRLQDTPAPVQASAPGAGPWMRRGPWG